MCIQSALSKPAKAATQTFETIEDEAKEAEIIYALQPLPGTPNLFEKRMPVIRLYIPLDDGPFGSNNLHEQKQIQDYYGPLYGIQNLDEKSLPEGFSARINAAERFGFKRSVK